MDAEATPRQPTLPVPYAMSLTPGAIISGTTAASPATLVVRNLGTGDALRVEGASLNGNLNVSGSLVGGTHSHDTSYYNKTQTDRATSTPRRRLDAQQERRIPVLTASRTRTGPGIVATAAGNIALRGETGSTARSMAGVMGVAGWTSTMLSRRRPTPASMASTLRPRAWPASATITLGSTGRAAQAMASTAQAGGSLAGESTVTTPDGYGVYGPAHRAGAGQ